MRSVLSVKEMLHIATMLNSRSNDVSCFVVVIVWSVLIEKKVLHFATVLTTVELMEVMMLGHFLV